MGRGAGSKANHTKTLDLIELRWCQDNRYSTFYQSVRGIPSAATCLTTCLEVLPRHVTSLSNIRLRCIDPVAPPSPGLWLYPRARRLVRRPVAEATSVKSREGWPDHLHLHILPSSFLSSFQTDFACSTPIKSEAYTTFMLHAQSGHWIHYQSPSRTRLVQYCSCPALVVRVAFGGKSCSSLRSV